MTARNLQLADSARQALADAQQGGSPFSHAFTPSASYFNAQSPGQGSTGVRVHIAPLANRTHEGAAREEELRERDLSFAVVREVTGVDDPNVGQVEELADEIMDWLQRNPIAPDASWGGDSQGLPVQITELREHSMAVSLFEVTFIQPR